MTQLFITRAELLPTGETTEDHRKCQKEEVDLIEKDRSRHRRHGGGIFNGCFRYSAHPRAPIIRDTQDRVDRCPNCTWELEEGECGTCGYPHGETPMADHTNSESEPEEYLERGMIRPYGLGGDNNVVPLSYGDSESDYFSEDSDAIFGIDGDGRHAVRRRALMAEYNHRHHIHGLRESDNEDSSEDDEDDEEAGSLDGFVVDDEEERPSSLQWNPTAGSSPRSIHYDTEEVLAMAEDYRTYDTETDYSLQEEINNDRLAMYFPGSTVNGLEDDSDEAPIVRRGRRGRPERPSTSSASSINGSPVINATLRHHINSPRSRQEIDNPSPAHGFSPVQNSPTHDARGSGSSSRISRGVPIEIQSDSDASVLARRSQRRRPVVRHALSDDENAFVGFNPSRTRSPHNSSGTVTVGRKSPEIGLAERAESTTNDLRTYPFSPIVIHSSPTRQGNSRSEYNSHRFKSSMSPQAEPAAHLNEHTGPNRASSPRSPWQRQRLHGHGISRQQPYQHSRHRRIQPTSPRHMNQTTTSRPYDLPTTGSPSEAEQRFRFGAQARVASRAARKVERQRMKQEQRRRDREQVAEHRVNHRDDFHLQNMADDLDNIR